MRPTIFGHGGGHGALMKPFYIDLEPIHFFQPILRLEAQKGETKGVAKGTAIVSPQVGNQADFNGAMGVEPQQR
jgi:hypothetical protein